MNKPQQCAALIVPPPRHMHFSESVLTNAGIRLHEFGMILLWMTNVQRQASKLAFWQ